MVAGYKSTAEDTASFSNPLTDSELHQLVQRVQREATVHFGSISNALRTMVVDTEICVKKTEVKRLFKDFGEQLIMVERLFSRYDPEGRNKISLKTMRQIFDPISLECGDSYVGSESPPEFKSTKCQDKLEFIRMTDNERYQSIKLSLKKIGVAASQRYANTSHAFKTLDRDKSGYVNRKEIRDFFRSYGFDKAAAEFFFEFFDTERTGLIPMKDFTSVIEDYINYDELQEGKPVSKDFCLDSGVETGTYSMPSHDPELCKVIRVLARNAAAKHSNARSCFKSMDLDGTGTITPNEMRIFFRNYGYPSSGVADRFFQFMDADGNGVIGYQEFKDFWTPFIHPTSEPGQADDNTPDGDMRASEYNAVFSTPNLKLAYESGLW